MGNETGFEPNLNTTEGTSVQQATEHKKWWGISSTTRRWKPSWTGELETLRVVLNGRNKRASTPTKKWCNDFRSAVQYTLLKFLPDLIEKNLFHSLWSPQPLGEVRPRISYLLYITFFPFRSMFRLSFSSIALSKENRPTALAADTATRCGEKRSSRE